MNVRSRPVMHQARKHKDTPRTDQPATVTVGHFNPVQTQTELESAAAQEALWEEEYSSLLATLRTPPAPTGAERERRREPRFNLRSSSVSVQIQAQSPVVNVSACGAQYRAMVPVGVGQRLNLVISGAFLVEATVVDCTEDRTGEVGKTWPWRVHCRFESKADGRRLIVMLHAMDNLIVDS